MQKEHGTSFMQASHLGKEIRMQRTSKSIAGLAFVLTLALAGGVEAQQHQQHHPESTKASEAQSADTSTKAPERAQMMVPMQGMMGMRGHGGMMGHMMGQGHMRGHMFLQHLGRLTQQLDLTDEQETEVRSLVRTHMKDAIRAKADIDVNRLDLRDLLEAESPDLPKVKALLQTIAAQKAELHFAHITLMQDINTLLTPAQQEKFRTMRRPMMQDGSRMMGQGGMMQQGHMRGPSGTRNPCGMMGRGVRVQ